MFSQTGCRRSDWLRLMALLIDRRAGHTSQSAAVRHGAVAITAIDGKEHLVPQFALAERREAGWYPAWCGTWVAGASMCEPPGTPCDLCACVAQVINAGS
jgi:hypothetical protein